MHDTYSMLHRSAILEDPVMSARALAHYLRRIRVTSSISVLNSLAREIVERFPQDEATPRLTEIISQKVRRLVRLN